MSRRATQPTNLQSGSLNFTIESRIIRELGERLVKQPEVALLELIKNAYDADATNCVVVHEFPDQIIVRDNGHGMTLDQFTIGWMRVGTSSKESGSTTEHFGRIITGEKGIGRFAVRFLGRALTLESVAFDEEYGFKTSLQAEFDWLEFDRNEDLSKIEIPYNLTRAGDRATGTELTIKQLRTAARHSLDLRSVRTASIAVVSPYQALLRKAPLRKRARRDATPDPGFSLEIVSEDEHQRDGDTARAILDNFVLRAVIELKNNRLQLTIYRKGSPTPSVEIADRYESAMGPVYADIRFFPERRGTYVGMPVDGRRAKTWVKEHSGVRVFDRSFQVHPYGTENDDWLRITADTARRHREPSSPWCKLVRRKMGTASRFS